MSWGSSVGHGSTNVPSAKEVETMAGSRCRRVDGPYQIYRSQFALLMLILLALAPTGCMSDPQAERKIRSPRS